MAASGQGLSILYFHRVGVYLAQGTRPPPPTAQVSSWLVLHALSGPQRPQVWDLPLPPAHLLPVHSSDPSPGTPSSRGLPDLLDWS